MISRCLLTLLCFSAISNLHSATPRTWYWEETDDYEYVPFEDDKRDTNSEEKD